MAEVAGKVERNIRERVASARETASRQVEVVRTAVRELLSLKPVAATVDLVVDTIDNVGDFLKKQAEIFRRWASA